MCSIVKKIAAETFPNDYLSQCEAFLPCSQQKAEQTRVLPGKPSLYDCQMRGLRRPASSDCAHRRQVMLPFCLLIARFKLHGRMSLLICDHSFCLPSTLLNLLVGEQMSHRLAYGPWAATGAATPSALIDHLRILCFKNTCFATTRTGIACGVTGRRFAEGGIFLVDCFRDMRYDHFHPQHRMRQCLRATVCTGGMLLHPVRGLRKIL